MNFIKDYMTNAGQVPRTEEQEGKHLFLTKLKPNQSRDCWKQLSSQVIP